jgi:tetratricopeptide (TPR) repeat protein
MKHENVPKAIKLGIAALLLFLIAAGCGGKGHMTATSRESTLRRHQDISGAGYNHFVNANLLELFGVYNEAADEYQSALKYFPESATIRTDYARLLFRMSRFSEALEQAQLIEPKSSEVCLLIGDCYRLTGRMEAAVKYYERAVALDRDNINAYWYLAGYYRQADKIDSAISVYYELARLSDTYRIWHELGAMLGSAGRYEEALTAFKRSIEINPDVNNLNAYIGLATTYNALDSLPKAEEVFQQAIDLAPDEVRIYRQMLDIYMEREDIKNSIRVSEKLISLVPSDWIAQRRHGVLLLSDDRFDEADSLFASRIEFGDDNALNYFYRGVIAMQQERYADALPFLDSVTRKEPAFADGWLNLGLAYAQQEAYDSAIANYRRGLEFCTQSEDSIRMTFALGAALERSGQFYDAVDTFKGLLEIDSNHAATLNYLGYMLADRGEQLKYALQLIERALEISPDNGAYIDSYAWVQFKLGNYELALSELKKAVDLLNNDAIIYEHLGDVYRAMGNRAEAERNYRRALEINPGSINIEEKLK